jgi:hypothetical protein
MMEAARTSETLVNFYQTAQRYNPEDSHLHTHRRDNLKSYMTSIYLSNIYLKSRRAISVLFKTKQNHGKYLRRMVYPEYV